MATSEGKVEKHPFSWFQRLFLTQVGNYWRKIWYNDNIETRIIFFCWFPLIKKTNPGISRHSGQFCPAIPGCGYASKILNPMILRDAIVCRCCSTRLVVFRVSAERNFLNRHQPSNGTELNAWKGFSERATRENLPNLYQPSNSSEFNAWIAH